MTQSRRLPEGGAIDRSRPLAFDYDGTRFEGYAGDTLASALLANGVHLVARGGPGGVQQVAQDVAVD